MGRVEPFYWGMVDWVLDSGLRRRSVTIAYRLVERRRGAKWHTFGSRGDEGSGSGMPEAFVFFEPLRS